MSLFHDDAGDLDGLKGLGLYQVGHPYEVLTRPHHHKVLLLLMLRL
jgi:hypothetical protein